MIVDCICGAKMQCIVAKKAYTKCNTVYCDACSGQFFNKMVYHCPMGNDPRFHKGGFDLCVKCANKKVDAEKKDEQQESDEDTVVSKSKEPKKEPKEEPKEAFEPKQEPKQEIAQPAPVEPSAPEEPEQVEPPKEEEQDEEEEEEEEEFAYQAQLTTIKEILAFKTDEKDDMIKTLLVQNKGDVSRVVPLLLQ